MTKMTAWAWFALLLGFFAAVVAGADETLGMTADYLPMPKENTGISMSNFMLPIPVFTEQTSASDFISEASSDESETSDNESLVSSTEYSTATSSSDMPTVTVEEKVTTTTSSSTVSSSTVLSSYTISSNHVSVILITRTMVRAAQETGGATPAPQAPVAEVTAVSPQQSSTASTQTVVASSDWRTEMLNSINAIRASVGKPALAINQGLNYISQAHSAYQLALGYITHSDATTIGARVSSINIKWAGISENIASGQSSVAQVMQAWKNSPGHYANMIGDYDIVGFGKVGNYWTQDFVKYTT